MRPIFWFIGAAMRWVYIAHQDLFPLNKAIIAQLGNVKSHKLGPSQWHHSSSACHMMQIECCQRWQRCINLEFCFPIPVLRCTKQLFPRESVLLHCKQNGGSRQVCDGHDAFWMALVFWPFGTNKLVYQLQVTSYNWCWWQGGHRLGRTCSNPAAVLHSQTFKENGAQTHIHSVIIFRRIKKNFHINKFVLLKCNLAQILVFLPTDIITLQLFSLLCTHVNICEDSFIESFCRLDKRRHIVKQIVAYA